MILLTRAVNNSITMKVPCQCYCCNYPSEQLHILWETCCCAGSISVKLSSWYFSVENECTEPPQQREPLAFSAEQGQALPRAWAWNSGSGTVSVYSSSEGMGSEIILLVWKLYYCYTHLKMIMQVQKCHLSISWAPSQLLARSGQVLWSLTGCQLLLCAAQVCRCGEVCKITGAIICWKIKD